MEARPKIKIALTSGDKVFELIGWLALVIFWGLAFYYCSILPDTIPIHFDIEGQIDGYGSKWIILLSPVIATPVFVLLTVLNKFPYTFNYPVTITPENAEWQYRNATGLTRCLKLNMTLAILLPNYEVIRAATGKPAEFGPWFFPLTLILILALLLIPSIYFVGKAMRQK